MNKKHENWSITQTCSYEGDIDPRPQYQRSSVWSERRNQLLIDSILRGFDIPKFYLREIKHKKYDYEVVDGQQRLRAIWDFCSNKFALGEKSDDLPTFGSLKGKFYKDLKTSSKERKFFDKTQLNFCVIEADDTEVKRMFRRLQLGMTLTPPEYRNAMDGNMRDFIDSLEKHKVFKSVNKKDDRYLFADWIAHVVHLELYGFGKHMKADSLRGMYEKEEGFKLIGKDAKNVKKVLNYLSKALGPKSSIPEMDIKWGFVDLYYLIRELIKTLSITGHETKFRKFYRDFEKERRKYGKDPQPLISKPKAKITWKDQMLYDYIMAFKAQGGVKTNLQRRHQVYLSLFLDKYPKLKPKDPRRLFTPDEKIVLWHRSGEKCCACSKKFPLKQMEADHIKSHASGGPTIIDNGQCLCKPCHAKKTAVASRKRAPSGP
jgi:hypothetical protein